MQIVLKVVNNRSKPVLDVDSDPHQDFFKSMKSAHLCFQHVKDSSHAPGKPVTFDSCVSENKFNLFERVGLGKNEDTNKTTKILLFSVLFTNIMIVPHLVIATCDQLCNL